jgi:light-regulated signal transduction histidine kinase (bacteriophytochrome)
MVTDITERKRAEEQLRRTADRLAMLHDMDQAIVSAQSLAEIGRAALARMRRMVPCQRCLVVLFDFQSKEAQMIAGFSAGMHLQPAPLPLGDLASSDTLRGGSVRYIEDLGTVEDSPPLHRQFLAEGIRAVLSVPLLVEGEAIGEIILGSSTPLGFNAEHRDIALEVAAPLAIAIQHARLRNELAQQSGELERRLAERSAAVRAATAELETVLYSVSHDLRAPLRQLMGFSRLLLEESGPELDPSSLHYAQRIHEAADRMSTLVDDLVNASRVARQDLLRREVPLTPLVEDLVGQLRAQTNGRAIEWQIEELPNVEGDTSLIKLALNNLLSNAVKFTRPRAQAIIRIRPVEFEGQAGIAIQDNGVGFKMTYAGKLFGMFQRLHRADEFEGNGAGLAVVQRIAHKHGGRVWAEAEPDKGATFYLTLGRADPRKRGSSSAAEQSTGSAP